MNYYNTIKFSLTLLSINTMFATASTDIIQEPKPFNTDVSLAIRLDSTYQENYAINYGSTNQGINSAEILDKPWSVDKKISRARIDLKNSFDIYSIDTRLDCESNIPKISRVKFNVQLNESTKISTGIMSPSTSAESASSPFMLNIIDEVYSTYKVGNGNKLGVSIEGDINNLGYELTAYQTSTLTPSLIENSENSDEIILDDSINNNVFSPSIVLQTGGKYDFNNYKIAAKLGLAYIKEENLIAMETISNEGNLTYNSLTNQLDNEESINKSKALSLYNGAYYTSTNASISYGKVFANVETLTKTYLFDQSKMPKSNFNNGIDANFEKNITDYAGKINVGYVITGQIRDLGKISGFGSLIKQDNEMAAEAYLGFALLEKNWPIIPKNDSEAHQSTLSQINSIYDPADNKNFFQTTGHSFSIGSCLYLNSNIKIKADASRTTKTFYAQGDKSNNAPTKTIFSAKFRTEFTI